MADSILKYVTDLTEATRHNEIIALGVSPRGALALCRMAKACAYLDHRDYVTPKDIEAVFIDVCGHRIVLSSKARFQEKTRNQILEEILKNTKAPKVE